MGKILSVLILLCLIVAGAGVYLMLRDTTPPTMVLTPDSATTGPKREFTVSAAKLSGAGIKSVRVAVTQGQKETVLLQRNLTAAPKDDVEKFTLEQAGLHEGPFELSVVVTDKSFAHFGAGNTARITKTMTLDTMLPVVSILSQLHSITQGGASCVVYQINKKEIERSGVIAGDRFFPGYRLDSGNYACIFAFPWYMDISKFQPKLYVEDAAGNERAINFNVQARAAKFKHDSLNVSDDFLAAKMPQYESMYPTIKDSAQLYVTVNHDLRKQNMAKLLEFAKQTAPKPLWDGPFLRLPNAAPRANYGDGRTYLYKNAKIDDETHLGVDLASVANAPVPAANTGKVLFTGFFGIYGNAVVIDHGWGLQTIYGHLSQINVKAGDDVKRGDIIGRTGATGLAAGDHLHFGIILNGLEIQPIEWWDGHWIKDNITGKFQ